MHWVRRRDKKSLITNEWGNAKALRKYASFSK